MKAGIKDRVTVLSQGSQESVWPLAGTEKLHIGIHWQESFDTLVLR